MTHSDACRLVLLELSRLGCLAWRCEVGLFTDERGNRRTIGVPGQADIAGYAPDGAGISVEVKTGSGRLNGKQIPWRDAVLARHARHHVARPDYAGWKEDLARAVAPNS